MPALRSLSTKLIALTALMAIDAMAQTTAGAGSVVVKDIPAGVFAAGNPCRVIRQI